MLPLIIPVVIGTIMAGFAGSVLVAAISSPFLIMGGLGTVAAVFAPFVLLASLAVSVFLAGVAAICSAFLTAAALAASHFLGFINLVPLFLGFMAIAPKLALLASPLVVKPALVVTKVALVTSHFLGFNPGSVLLGLMTTAPKLPSLGASLGAKLALMGESATASMAESLRVKKKGAQATGEE